MIALLLDRYEKELKYKISLKMIPNKTEEQILYQYFKFFDLDSSGFCNLRDFIKSNEKLGVVLTHIQDFQDIFNYFDIDHSGLINYRKFCKEIFKPRDLSNKNYQTQSEHQNKHQQIRSDTFTSSYSKRKPTIEKLCNILLENGSARAMLSLYKEFKFLDFNNSGRLNIDDFIKIFTNKKINLSISDIQTLFHAYEMNNNGFFYYEEMFKDLKGIFWNQKRGKLISDLYDQLTQENSNNGIMISELKKMFNPKGHKYISEVGENFLQEEYNYIVDSYMSIKRMNKGNFQLSKNDFDDFFKFYTFGIDSNDDFIDIISNCFFLNEDKDNQYYNQINTPIINKEVYQHNLNNNYVNPQQKEFNQIDSIISKLKKSLMSLGVKTFFSLMKHFKYYDNGTKMIIKFDFAKVLKDFNLNLTINEIERIFEAFCPDAKKDKINYEEFIYSLTQNEINDNRIKEIEDIYVKIASYAKSIGEKVSVDLIKSLYWSKENFFGLEETQALNDFCDNIELYHYGIKGNKSSLFSLDEFIDFYTIISFLIANDKQFVEMIQTEWKKVKKEPNIPKKVASFPLKVKVNKIEQQQCDQYERPKTPIINYQPERRTNYTKSKSANRIHTPIINNKISPLNKLQIKLRKRGIRGLMNLHKQFLFSCNNLQIISFEDFVKVLKLQRFDLLNEDYDFLFQQYSQEGNKNNLNFPYFIRAFKKVLNEKRLSAVEKVFGFLDREQTENLYIDDIKLKFNPKKHHDVIRGIKNEDEIITEFLDCFELNYNLLTTAENPETSNLVSFEEFANFYEYVSFLYDSDNDFIKLVEDSWL